MYKIHKQQIRKTMRSMLQLLNNLEERSLSVIEKLKCLNEFKNSKNIVLYSSIQYEIETIYLIHQCLQTSKNIYLPYIENVQIAQINSLDELVLGKYNILEPANNEYLNNLEVIDTVIIPGVAYDKDGNRLGKGMGWYDRFLQRLSPNVLKVALVFDIQIINYVPKDVHDISVDIIITEDRIIDTRNK
jgi:5-formyltetrahydrofolate cyclo-ligase